jgi:thiamine-phosphate pyrophosphorylase
MSLNARSVPEEGGDRNTAYRIIDANLNRAAEGLRTLEDIARFQDFAAIQRCYKNVRHQLTEVTKDWEFGNLLRSRDAARDVGREVKTEAEADRSGGLFAIVNAAVQRVQQSLRTLEEMAKFVYPKSAPSIEALRYRVYDVNASLQLRLTRDLSFFKNAQLYVLVDCHLPQDEFEKRIREISLAGVPLIQIRDKTRDASDLIRYTETAVDCVDGMRTRIIVNDRADVAACTCAWGLHVGQTDLTISQARKLLPSQSVVGLSTHTLDQVRSAIDESVDCIGCGPVFSSKTKSFSELSGLQFLTEAAELLSAQESSLPAFAIGGIDEENIQHVMNTGFRRVAVSSCVWKSKTPARAAESLLGVLDRYR